MRCYGELSNKEMKKLKYCEKRYDELSLSQMYNILKTRIEVFVVEQACPYQDLDDLDQRATHIWYESEESGEIAAYIRVVDRGVSYPEFCSIGRVITQANYRGQGLGNAVFKKGIDYCQNHFKGISIKISAQLYLKRFYMEHGFNQEGGIYLEDGIPHMAMICNNP